MCEYCNLFLEQHLGRCWGYETCHHIHVEVKRQPMGVNLFFCDAGPGAYIQTVNNHVYIMSHLTIPSMSSKNANVFSSFDPFCDL